MRGRPTGRLTAAVASWRDSGLPVELPTDLALVAGLVWLVDLVVLLDAALGLSLRVQFGLPLVGVLLGVPMLLFAPGYAVLAAIYPEMAASGGQSDARHLSRLERLVLSVPASLVVVPVAAVLVLLGPWRLTLLPVLAVLSLLTFGAVWIAAHRRPSSSGRGPTGRRGMASPHRGPTATVAGLTRRGSVVFVGGLVLLAAVVVGMATAPPAGSSFSEASLVTLEGAGEPTAAALPTEFTAGEPRTIGVFIENHEGRTTTYTVLVRLQRVADGGEGRAVLQQAAVDRFSVTVDHGGRRVVERPVEPPFAGERLRLQYLVFTGDVPADPTPATADLTLRLWITVA